MTWAGVKLNDYINRFKIMVRSFQYSLLKVITKLQEIFKLYDIFCTRTNTNSVVNWSSTAAIAFDRDFKSGLAFACLK